MHTQISRTIPTNPKPFGKSGFSLVEMMICFIVIGILAAVIAPNIGQISGSAATKAKKANVESMNKMLATIYAIGGKIEDDAGAEVNTSTSQTAIDSLSKNPPLVVDGFTFSLQPKPNAESYVLKSGTQPYKVFDVNTDPKLANAKP